MAPQTPRCDTCGCPLEAGQSRCEACSRPASRWTAIALAASAVVTLVAVVGLVMAIGAGDRVAMQLWAMLGMVGLVGLTVAKLQAVLG